MSNSHISAVPDHGNGDHTLCVYECGDHGAPLCL